MNRRALLLVAAWVLLPSAAWSQALTSLSSLRVGYNTRKATVRPAGAMKIEIDDIDRHIAEATRLGQNAELRRLIARGQSVLVGRPWTDVLDFNSSLVLRTEHTIADSGLPYAARVEQIYRPAIDLTRPLTAHIVLRKRPMPGAAGAAPQPGEVVKDFATVDGVGRDLRDTPYAFEIDVHDVADGTYQLAVVVGDEADGQARELGTATLLVSLKKGLTDTVSRLTATAAAAPATVSPDILYPVDRMRNVNRGRLELRTFDPDRDFAAALAVAAMTKGGKAPFAGKTGDFKRHYLLEPAGEIMPYRMYVPTSYTSSRPYPLIIALHGLGGTEDSFFDGYEQTFPPLAEQHGYIVAAPLGFRVDGSYGWGLGNPPADPATRRVQDLSEQDVMRVLQLVKEQYKIDDSRIYLIGHSMGAIGTWKMAPKYPEIFAAIATFAGSGAPATLERIKSVPQFVVHGDADATVNVQGSRAMVARARELGIDVKYVEVPGGSHGNVLAPNFAAMFEFLNAHVKAGKATR
jgi:poly(3-hydroxybutyrate) depolymerase